jgi:hypothetical protein
VHDSRIESLAYEPFRQPQLPAGRVRIADGRSFATDLQQVVALVELQLLEGRGRLEDGPNTLNIEALQGINQRGLALRGSPLTHFLRALHSGCRIAASGSDLLVNAKAAGHRPPAT